MPNEPQNKAANLYDWIVSRIHMEFSVMADNLLGEGIVSQEERIALSNAIGDALGAFNEHAEGDLAQLRARRPWQELPPEMALPVIPAKYAVKALGTNRVGGYMMLWGDENSKDLDGEWFTPETEELTSIFDAMGRLPYLYNHATDKQVKSSVVGHIDVLQADDIGLWYEAQLDQNNQYVDAIRKLVSRQALGTSSGTLPGARKVAKSGQILRWAIVEGSATPTPADPRQVLERPIAEIKSAFSQIGISFEPESGASGTGDEESRLEIDAKLKLLDLLSLESELTGV